MTTFFQLRNQLVEKTLTSAEKKKREEVAQAIERDQPGMDKAKKMAIATATAKRVAESSDFAKSVLAAAQKVSPSARMVTQDQKKKETEDEMKRRAAENKPRKPVEPMPDKYPLGGRDEKSGRSYSEEVELDEVTHQAKTTMKHIKNATPGEKAAAKDIKPGVAGYRDRIAMLHSAAARGGLKEQGVAEGSYQGKGNHRPGWMLRADPELAARFKEIEKRRQMMAKYAGKDLPKAKEVKEESTQIDELKKSTVKSYANKRQAQVSYTPAFPEVNKVSQRITKNSGEGLMRALKRIHGMSPTSEEVEINELDTKTLVSYASKASNAQTHRGMPTQKVDKRYAGVARALGKVERQQAKEEVEPVSELNLFRKKETAEQKRARLTKEFEARKANRPENKPKQPNVWDHINAPEKRGTNEEVKELDEISSNLMGAVRTKREQQRHDARTKLDAAKQSGNKDAIDAAKKEWDKAHAKVTNVSSRLTSYHVKKNAEEDIRNKRLGYDPISHRSYNE